MHYFRGKAQSVFLFHPTSSLHLPENSTPLTWALLKGINGFTFTAFSDERQTLSTLQVQDFKIKALILKLHTDRCHFRPPRKNKLEDATVYTDIRNKPQFFADCP